MKTITTNALSKTLLFAIFLSVAFVSCKNGKGGSGGSNDSTNTASGDSAWADPREVRKENFKGDIKLDVRDSKEDWDAYTPKRAPANSPNVLFILYDDTGLG